MNSSDDYFNGSKLFQGTPKLRCSFFKTGW